MSEKNFEFLNLERQEPKLKAVEVRKVDFREIYEDQTMENAVSQSSRCLDCGNPYCQWKCPLHNKIPEWLKLLEQSSTMADKVKVQFINTDAEVPSCYYEFAKRYPDSSGNLYQGFVSKSADKIFESTNK